MVLGPLDKRLKRSRCQSCAARHLKCSNNHPCERCNRDSLVCEYRTSGSKLITHKDWRHDSAVSTPLHSSSSVVAGPIAEVRFFHEFFDIFLPQNKFSGLAGNWHSYIRSNISQCQGHFSAAAGLGALSMYKHGRCASGTLVSALASYQGGINYLQDQIQRTRDQWDMTSMLSVTFLLSIFELMCDATGVGWHAHMGFATSVVLKSCGPEHFRSPGALGLYREIRFFEISRAAVYSQATFLTDLEWLEHDQAYHAITADWNALDTTFDLFLQCLKFGQEIKASERGSSTQVDSLEPRGLASRSPDIVPDARVIRKSVLLKAQLDAFSSKLSTKEASGETAVAQIYFYALSIFLCGLFGDDIIAENGRKSVILSPREIADFREEIITRSREVVECRQGSPFLLLVPFSIAGRRCTESGDCQRILDLLWEIEQSFAVAGMFRRGLLELWRDRGLVI